MRPCAQWHLLLALSLAACTASIDTPGTPGDPPPTVTPPIVPDKPNPDPKPIDLPPLFGTLPGLTQPPDVTLAITPGPELVPSGPDVPTVKAVADGRWNVPGTWSTGAVPVAGDIVSIPRGRAVELAGETAALQGLWVAGTLTFANVDVALTTRFVMLTGRMQAGTATAPYTRRAVITMTGVDVEHDVLGMGTKGISVMEGGLLKLHGEPRLSWSMLDADAAVGATTLTLADDASTWRAGDSVVLTTGSFDPRESEVLTVTSVSGKEVTFSSPLRFPRTALKTMFAGKVLDERPQVGLLSRNILIQGDPAGDALGFGGHVMVMSGGHAQISGIELTRAGQRGHKGRYPIHWHIVGEREGNYLMGSSIHDTYQRACVLHSTHHVAIDGNTAYNIPNHAFVWAEDGDEVGNRLTRNLAVLVKSPPPENFAFTINSAFQGNSAQAEQRSAAFWGRSFKEQVLRGNIAAGTVHGFGFFFDLFSVMPFPGDEGGGLVFDGNIAYASFKVVDRGNQINYPEATDGHGLFVSTNTNGHYTHSFKHYTGHHNASAAWIEDRSSTLSDSILADNNFGVMVLRGTVEGLTVVGNSGHPSTVGANSQGIRVAGSNHGGRRAPIIRNSTVIDHPGTGFTWPIDNISPEAVVRGITFVNTTKRVSFLNPEKFDFAKPPNFALDDLDGVVAGDQAPTRVVLWDSNLVTPQCREVSEANVLTCPLDQSALLRSSADVDLIDEDGIPTYLQRFPYADHSMPARANDSVSYVAKGHRYAVRSEQPNTARDFTLSGAANQPLELALAAGAAPTTVTLDGVALPPQASLAALRSSATSGFFFGAGELTVRVLGTQAEQKLVLAGDFLTNSTPGRLATALPAGAVEGASVSIIPGAAPAYLRRYALPTQAPRVTRLVQSSRLDDATGAAALADLAPGEAAVVTGFFEAPEAGTYRLGLWGAGGGSALFVGGRWVMGEPNAGINSNYVRNGQLTTDATSFQVHGVVSLQAGWHPFTALLAKQPGNTGAPVLHLRLTKPSTFSTWEYANLRRAP